MFDRDILMANDPDRVGNGNDGDDGTGVGLATRTRTRTKEPTPYRVLMLNDAVTLPAQHSRRTRSTARRTGRCRNAASYGRTRAHLFGPWDTTRSCNLRRRAAMSS